MSANKINTLPVWLMIGFVGMLAWFAIAQNPDRTWAYVIAMGFMPASVFVLSVLNRMGTWSKDSATAYRLLRVSLLGAGAVLAGSLLFTLGQNAGYISSSANSDPVTWMIIAVWWAALSIIIYRRKNGADCAPKSE